MHRSTRSGRRRGPRRCGRTARPRRPRQGRCWRTDWPLRRQRRIPGRRRCQAGRDSRARTRSGPDWSCGWWCRTRSAGQASGVHRAGPVPSRRPRYLHPANGGGNIEPERRAVMDGRRTQASAISKWYLFPRRIRFILMPRRGALRWSTRRRPRGASNDEEGPGSSKPTLAGPYRRSPGRPVVRSVRRW